MTLQEACERFVDYLDKQVVRAARGDDLQRFEVDPAGRLWLGRLSPRDVVMKAGLGERGERIDPCAVGMRVRPRTKPATFQVLVTARAWVKRNDEWVKTSAISESIDVAVEDFGEKAFGAGQIARALSQVTGVESGLSAEVHVELESAIDGTPELTLRFVNTSPAKHRELKDTNLYECAMEARGLDYEPYVLEGLPDSFRYERRVPAYGLNCGVEVAGSALRTTDSVVATRGRPTYWSLSEREPPDLRFATLGDDPLPSLRALVSTFDEWGAGAWSDERLARRAVDEGWNAPMRAEAAEGARAYRDEVGRVKRGVEMLAADERLLRAFRLMNQALFLSTNGKYDSWRPFQVGFLLANVASLVEPERPPIGDVVWFATGGGKTETYLGIIVTAAFLDRLRGKSEGVTAWSRFPLRMLSLQQTQRFADALGAAEIVRRREEIPGAPFSLGFLVGDNATPNRIEEEAKEGKPDPDDPEMPKQYRRLRKCPFCHGDKIEMAFNRRVWRLEHSCASDACPWPKSEPLPFFIVDDEIFRLLPTVIVGTLDKAALLSMQASMRGLVGPPWGKCPVEGHGFTYAGRQKRPTGCLVPGCTKTPAPLPISDELFGMSLRLQDELHLLKDSLGAVDSHYEALLDHLQSELTGTSAKVLGSSATLAGFEKQVDVLYRRKGRVFPALGPSATDGFWSSESSELARRFIALAPRAATVEFAVDTTVTVLQRSVRRLLSEPDVLCAELGVPTNFAAELLSLYGVDVIYGNTLRDLDATVRSFETQIEVEGALNEASLTGRTQFEDVFRILERLESPEEKFEERIHLVAASAMMSHGVDIDRLNVMVMIGVPLTTAEFIQTTARVGRRYPGLVIVFPKIARERDASVYRSFEHFVRQGDRFVEPVPITRRSRRVLAKTIPGFAMARILHIHEPRNGKSLVMIDKFRKYVEAKKTGEAQEFDAVVAALQLGDAMDEGLREDLKEWYQQFFANMKSPPPAAKFTSELCPEDSPMISLRDVEEQAPIFSSVTK